MSLNYTGVSFRALLVRSVGLALTAFIDPSMQAKNWGFHHTSRLEGSLWKQYQQMVQSGACFMLDIALKLFSTDLETSSTKTKPRLCLFMI